MPVGVPWQAPMLQPAWLRAGMTSRRKLTGAGWSMRSTLTVVVASTLPRRATIVAVPLPLGTTCPFGETTAISGLRLTHSSARVRSRTEPSA